MNDDELRELVRIANLSGVVTLAFQILVFGCVIALLGRLRRRVAVIPVLRATSWALFVILALIAYVLTPIPAWALNEHLIFWKTGEYFFCHTSDIVGAGLPLLVGLVVAAKTRQAVRWMSVLGGGLLVASGAAFLLFASYLWATFPGSGEATGMMWIGPHRDALFPVIAAAAIVIVVGCLVVFNSESTPPHDEFARAGTETAIGLL